MRLPKWPKEVSILGTTYAVIAADTVPSDEGDLCEGLMDEEAKKIWIRKNKDKSCMWSTLIHEIGHVWLRESGLEGNMSADMEEMIVISLEKHFAPALLGLIGKGHITSMKASNPAAKRGK